MKENKAITLIALVITIVVLIILAAVAINLSLGNNGIFNRAKTAKEQYQNGEANDQEIINKLDHSISAARITTDELDSLKSEIVELKQKTTEMETELTTLKSVTNANASRVRVIKRDYGAFGSNLSANTWHNLATVNLNNYGTGKAIVSCSVCSEETSATNLEVRIVQNGAEKANDRDFSGTASTTWRRVSATACMDYNTSTSIVFTSIFTSVMNPRFEYQILLIPDGQTIE